MKKVGVLGGLDPLATVDFLDKFYRAGDACQDQDHPPVEVRFCTAAPDRSAYLDGYGPSPIGHLREAAVSLKKSGAQFGVLICNTAHIWHRDLELASGLPFLHIAEQVRSFLDNVRKPVGLLCTPWTVKGRVYSRVLPREQLVEPSSEVLEHVLMPAIRLLKANRFDEARQLIARVLMQFERAGCESVILGCTELPIIARACATRMQLIDPNQLLADAARRYAMES
ncbi:MAG: amino acid racemase [Pseudomonas stutzeri]|nr:amino acid racemase [Stutzerimonas stutzeri]NIM88834.1 amino acid racemase [Stutzerimonas stutzeri]NIN81249.1 amino acid racemase [Stutzerimonas stutzeri]NIP00496.1 amino acid racemase [Stutzerimonas stutzeri]NIQ23097.1 amino acid racemase [Stutzerimonas stutzeri]